MRIAAVKTIRGMACTGVCLLLAACGGGGGGGASSGAAQLVTLNASNAETVGALAYDSADGLVPNTDLGAQVTIFSADGRSTGSKTSQSSVARLVTQAVAARRQTADVLLSSGCPVSGSFTIQIDENAGTGSLSYDQCDVGDGVVHGEIAFSNVAETGTPPNTTVTMSVSFNNLTVTEAGGSIGLNGAYSATVVSTADSETATVSGSLLSVSEGAHTHQLTDFTFTETSDPNLIAPTTTTADYTLNSTLIGGAVTVTTVTPFETVPGASYPQRGALLISGAQSGMRLTAQGDEDSLPLEQQVLLEIDADGDGVYETTQTTSWEQLDA